jgi:hypothetical protein
VLLTFNILSLIFGVKASKNNRCTRSQASAPIVDVQGVKASTTIVAAQGVKASTHIAAAQGVKVSAAIFDAQCVSK